MPNRIFIYVSNLIIIILNYMSLSFLKELLIAFILFITGFT